VAGGRIMGPTMRTSLCILAIAASPLSGQTSLAVIGLRAEYLANPVGIAGLGPRLSGRRTSGRPNTMQTAYQLQVGRTAAEVGRGSALLWDSGRIGSDASVFVDYAGPPLESPARLHPRGRGWGVPR